MKERTCILALNPSPTPIYRVYSPLPPLPPSTDESLVPGLSWCQLSAPPSHTISVSGVQAWRGWGWPRPGSETHAFAQDPILSSPVSRHLHAWRSPPLPSLHPRPPHVLCGRGDFSLCLAAAHVTQSRPGSSFKSKHTSALNPPWEVGVLGAQPPVTSCLPLADSGHLLLPTGTR